MSQQTATLANALVCCIVAFHPWLSRTQDQATHREHNLFYYPKQIKYLERLENNQIKERVPIELFPLNKVQEFPAASGGAKVIL